MTYTWFDDDEKYSIQQSSGQYYRIADSYSQWIAIHGARYAFTEEIPKEGQQDFNYALIIDGTFEPFFTTFKFGPNSGSRGNLVEGAFLGRLPIRDRTAGDNLGPINPKSADSAAFRNRRVVKENLVIIGLIDDAFNFSHHRFRAKDGKSRVDFAWVQDGRHQGKKSTVPFGREWDWAGISNAITTHSDNDDALMRALDLVASPGDPYLPTALRLRASHGTHVADLAAGYDPDSADYGDKDDRRIIAVQLPVFASQDTSGTSLMASIIAASDYIFKRALALSMVHTYPIPVILSFSYGFGGGPRNGQHIIERAIKKQARDYRLETGKINYGDPSHPSASAPVELILPAGNGHLSRTCAAGKQPAGNQTPKLDFEFRVQPQDRSSSFVEIWFPEPTQKIRVKVTSPGDLDENFKVDVNSSAYDNQVSLGSDRVLAAPDTSRGYKKDTVIGRISVDRPHEVPASLAGGSTPYWRVLLALAPSHRIDGKSDCCPHGKWQVACEGDSHSSGPIRAWIQRDEAVVGFGERGRQAYFDDTAYEDNRFDHLGDVVVTDAGQPPSVVKRDGTVSGIATNLVSQTTEDKPRIITVGSSVWDLTRPAVYSSAGYDEQFNAPRFMAPADTSRALTGILAATTRNGGKVPMGGTSVSTPQVARLLADLLQPLTPPERAAFKAVPALAHIATAAKRPPPPELAGNHIVRKKRLEQDCGFIPPHRDLARSIKRKTTRKGR